MVYLSQIEYWMKRNLYEEMALVFVWLAEVTDKHLYTLDFTEEKERIKLASLLVTRGWCLLVWLPVWASCCFVWCESRAVSCEWAVDDGRTGGRQAAGGWRAGGMRGEETVQKWEFNSWKVDREGESCLFSLEWWVLPLVKVKKTILKSRHVCRMEVLYVWIW